MKATSYVLISLFSVIALASCGGGGSTSGGSTTSSLSFPLQSGIKASVEQGASIDFTVTGTCSGTANIVSSTPISSTFEGIAAISSAGATTLNFTNCTPSSISGTATEYFDSNYVPLGTIKSDGEYGIYMAPPVIPVSVKVGDSGIIGTKTFYADNTKTLITGQEVISYVIEPDTANTAILNMIYKSYNSRGILTSTEQDRSRIMADGTLNPISADIQFANGSTTHLVLQVTPDTTAPTVLSTNPTSSSATVTPAATLTATFSEAMDPATVTTVEFILKNGATPVSGTVTYGGRTATFTPATFLTPSTVYTAMITMSVKDLAGNAMSSNYSWSFMTTAPDVMPPKVLSTSPADSASAVAINSVITATFSEAMDPATVTTAEFGLKNGTTPVSGTVTYSGATANFTPAAPLTNGTLYTATITAGVKDSAGNAMSLPYTWSFTGDGKISVLNFTVVDAEYSKSLEKIVMVSSVPGNQLHLYNPVTNSDTAVPLNLTPTSVAVSPDGLFAAVGHNAWISYVDLSTATLIKTLPVTADVFDIILAGNDYVYAFPRIDQWVQIHSINILSGIEVLSGGRSIRAGTKAKLHPGGAAIYGANNGLSPADIEKYDISGGAPVFLYDSPYHGDYAMCGDLWMSGDGFRIFTRCGNVFNATSLQATDMTYGGALQNLGLVRHLSHSPAIGKLTVIPDNSWNTTIADTEIWVFGYNFLTFEQSIKLPHFVVGNNQYAGHGRFVFYNSNGSKTFILLQADATSGMLYDYGIVTY